jgi:uncharacterized protein YdhG (YjbR/CyaY superfamily)
MATARKTAKRPRGTLMPQTRAYLAALPPSSRSVVRTLRTLILEAAPDATEHFSYGMPGFQLAGKPFLWYAAWKKHASLYPMSTEVVRAMSPDIEAFETSKGTIRFPLNAPLPQAFVSRLVRARVAELSGKSEERRGRTKVK